VPPEMLSRTILGRDVAQAVSHQHLTAAARARAQDVMWDLSWTKQQGGGASFLQVIRFPLPTIPPTAVHSSNTIQSSTIGE
jgi:hypothetical protein